MTARSCAASAPTLLALLPLLAGCHTAPDPTAARALAWLWNQRGPDGLLVSDVYGVLRRGESLTAAALLATARLPAAVRAAHTEAMNSAFAALAARASGRTTSDAPIDYPCYTAAHHLHAQALLRPTDLHDSAKRRIEQLREWQCSTANGWTEADPAFGGFGLGAGPPRQPDGDALVNLSTTTAVVEALRAAGIAATDPMIVVARTYVERCQAFGGTSDDGGFHGAPGGGGPGGASLGTKGGVDAAGKPRSYGTATADGVRALLACGHGADSPRVRAAITWLASRAGDTVPGLSPEFEPSLRFYHAASLALAERALGTSFDAAARARQLLLARQHADGSFRGFGDAMKEDDPVVATVLALIALR